MNNRVYYVSKQRVIDYLIDEDRSTQVAGNGGPPFIQYSALLNSSSPVKFRSAKFDVDVLVQVHGWSAPVRIVGHLFSLGQKEFVQWTRSEFNKTFGPLWKQGSAKSPLMEMIYLPKATQVLIYVYPDNQNVGEY